MKFYFLCISWSLKALVNILWFKFGIILLMVISRILMYIFLCKFGGYMWNESQKSEVPEHLCYNLILLKCFPYITPILKITQPSHKATE